MDYSRAVCGADEGRRELGGLYGIIWLSLSILGTTKQPVDAAFAWLEDEASDAERNEAEGAVAILRSPRITVGAEGRPCEGCLRCHKPGLRSGFL